MNVQGNCMAEHDDVWGLAPADGPVVGCIMAGLPSEPWSLPALLRCPLAQVLWKLQSPDAEHAVKDDEIADLKAGSQWSPSFDHGAIGVGKGRGVLESTAPTAALEPGCVAMPESPRLIDASMKLVFKLSPTAWPRVDAGSCMLVGQTGRLAAAPAGMLKVEAPEGAAYPAAPAPLLPVKRELAGAKEEAQVAAKVEAEERAQAAALETAPTRARKRKRAR